MLITADFNRGAGPTRCKKKRQEARCRRCCIVKVQCLKVLSRAMPRSFWRLNQPGEGIRVVEVELGRRGVDFFFPLKTYVDIGIQFFWGKQFFG